MDEIRLVNAIPLEKEMLEFAQYIGREATNECESTAESCADMVSGAPTIDPESLPPHWRKTAENPPARGDGDIIGNVLTVGYYFHITEGGKWIVTTMPSDIVAEHPDKYSLWMPTPKTPDLPAPKNGGIIIL